MGDPGKNFGAAWSWFDVLAGSREIFVGTDRERAALRVQRRSPLRRLLGCAS